MDSSSLRRRHDAQWTINDTPQDRPKLSLPRAAIPIIPGYYIFWGLAILIGASTVALLGTRSADPIGDHFLLLVALMSGPILLLTFGLRWGKLWGVRLLRAMSLAAAIVVGAGALVGLLAALSLIGARDRDTMLDGQFLLVLVAVSLPFGWLIWRTLRRVRWLDPRSRPSEGEPPMPQPRRRRR